jgi:signal transduction histidine kinase
MIPSTVATSDAIFPGQSEMARRMRAFDWSRTLLGAPDTWPRTLRTAVRLCLTSRFPILIWWGPGFSVLYNDAYIPFLGEQKHPRCLGQPGRECWAEIWDTVGAMLESVYRTGDATWSDDSQWFFARHLPREEVYVTFTFGPILADDGRTVEGVFCPSTETTEKVVAARRLDTLRRLEVAASDARTMKAACERAAGALSENSHDVAFAAIYRFDATQRRADLQSSAGLFATDCLPPTIDIADRGAWTKPFRSAIESRRPADVDLTAASPRLPGGHWPEPASRAIVFPLSSPGQEATSGFIVLGVSPRRPLDANYRSFFELVARHVATAMTNARVYEEDRKKAGALAELDRAKTRFFSNVSHEFRTPLTLMLAPLDDILGHPDHALSSESRELLTIVRRSGLRLSKLVNTLLDFSRIESGRVQASYEKTDLPAISAESASVFRSAIERAGLRFIVECPPLPEDVYVDREMWEKIVLNLLSNAFKFTFEGEIVLSVAHTPDGVTLTVRDTGTGIPDSELPLLFERFHRVEGARGRSAEGSGIGLALVEELVRLHGGTVRVGSELDRGSTFTVTIPTGTAHLPVDRIGAPRTLTSTALRGEAYLEEALLWLREDGPPGFDGDEFPATLPPPESRSTLGARILLADDNADMRAYLHRLLSEHYEVDAVADGIEALKSVRARAPDLVLTDVMMSGLDGFGLLAALRADEHLKTVPVILLSARAGEDARVEGMRAGADDYLAKPFSAKELLARVDARVELARVRREMAHKEQAARTTVAVSENQRRRIARELHDELGQQLTALGLGLKAVRSGLAEDSPVRHELQRLQALTVDVGRQMHRVVQELRPAVLDDMGLGAALSSYVDDWSGRSSIRSSFQSIEFDSERLPSHIETTIYRVVQEALTNIVKHAHASEVSVVLQRDGDEIVTTVEDDGCGFDVSTISLASSSSDNSRLGLVGMKERVALAGGILTVESNPGGTTILVRIPSARSVVAGHV